MVPRPPSSRRTLAASAEGTPYAVRIYETDLAATGLATLQGDAYQATITGNGAANTIID